MAPDTVEVLVAPRSFDRRAGRPVTGPIWLATSDDSGRRAELPEAGWTDFPVVILGWWLEALGALARGEAAEPDCYFMDGPYRFTVSDAGQALLRLRWFDTDVPVAEWRTPAERFAASVRKAAAAVLAECDRRGWADSDVHALRRVLGTPTSRPAA